MSRQLHKLPPRVVQTLSHPGRHSDGGGLYLVVDDVGRKRWVFIFRWRGKLKEMGLGSAASVKLVAARRKAQAARELLANGKNPIDARRSDRGVPAFGDFADGVVASLTPGFKNAKHAKQWETTLARHAAPLRAKLVDEITTDDVLGVLRPLWNKTPETAYRVMGRIERILDAARARGFRSGDNPARWRGHLDQLLPARRKLTRGHHPAMRYADVPAFVVTLRQRDAMAARALEFLILTAARTGEVLGATWEEFDLPEGLWVVPGERMKAGRPHRVPLSGRALVLVNEQARVSRGALVFPGNSSDRPLSNMSLTMLLRRMGVLGATVHGFRSAFRDWIGEETEFPRELAEAALAHTIGDATERAYRRADAVGRRRELMNAWSEYLGGSGVTFSERAA